MNTVRFWFPCSAVRGMPSTRNADLQECAESLDRQPGVANDAAHRDGVDRIVARDGDDAHAIAHDDMLTLAQNGEPGLLQRPDGIQMVDAGELGHSPILK